MVGLIMLNYFEEAQQQGHLISELGAGKNTIKETLVRNSARDNSDAETPSDQLEGRGETLNGFRRVQQQDFPRLEHRPNWNLRQRRPPFPNGSELLQEPSRCYVFEMDWRGNNCGL